MKLYVYISCTLWILFFYILGLSKVMHSPVLAFENKKNVSFLFPQGWGFFTKDPREVTVDAYHIQNDRLELKTIGNTQRDNLFGISRNNRYVGFELSKVIPKIPKDIWKNRIGKITYEVVPDSIFVVEVEGNLKEYVPGQEYLLRQYKPVPYAWAGKGQEDNRPYLVARIRIKE